MTTNRNDAIRGIASAVHATLRLGCPGGCCRYNATRASRPNNLTKLGNRVLAGLCVPDLNAFICAGRGLRASSLQSRASRSHLPMTPHRSLDFELVESPLLVTRGPKAKG